jgi:hypothetical protein
MMVAVEVEGATLMALRVAKATDQLPHLEHEKLLARVGQHICHHGTVGDRRAEGVAGRRVSQGEGQTLAHQARGADGEVQPDQMRMR